MRFRFAGTFFYVFFLANILATPKGSCYAKHIFELNADAAGVVVSVLALGAALLTSDVLGYFFGTVVWEVHRLLGGFSAKWAYLGIRKEVLDHLVRHPHASELAGIPEDVYFSYFWQQAPKECVDWASRKHVTFFTNWSVAVAIGVAYLCSFVVLCALQFSLTWWHLLVLVVAGLTSALLIVNGLGNWGQMKDLVDLHFYGCRDSAVADALRRIDPNVSTHDRHTD